MRFRFSSHSVALLAAVVLASTPANSALGDVFYGTVTEVSDANKFNVDTGLDKYVVRLVGIDLATEPSLVKAGKELVTKWIAGKRIQVRFEYRNESEEMVGRVMTIYNKKDGTKDMGELLVRAGLARRQRDFDYKCGCLATAENEARAAKVGLWAGKGASR